MKSSCVKSWTGCYGDSWKGLITPASFAHPAKFGRRLIERILDYMAEQSWIHSGDVIGDPFGGVGCGGIVAAYRGYRWIGVELEEKFFGMAGNNFIKHERKWASMKVPRPVIILGDSRQFDQHVDAVLTSPPYGDQFRQSGGGIYARNEHTRAKAGFRMEYGETTGQIGGLKSDSVEAVITSPPYESISAGAGGLNHLPARALGQQSGRKLGASQKADATYGKTPGQISQALSAPIDALLTSPPYEDSLRDQKDGIDWEKAKYKATSGLHQGRGVSLHATYGENTDGQIGGVKGETYWQAMAQVYHGCFKSLKPGGVMAIVVKDFVRDKRRMPFCDDTMRLLVWLGFEEIEAIHAMLTEDQIENDLFEGTRTKRTEKKSFFRRLYESRLAKNDPRRIDYEEVLFVRKP